MGLKYPMDELYAEYVNWCVANSVPTRARLSSREYEQQALSFLFDDNERSEYEACQGDSPSNAASDDRSVPSKC